MRRAWLAGLLLLGGLGLPLGGWYRAGRVEARRNEEALLARGRAGTEATVRAGAARLDVRMEVLRSSEEQRPYYHYQSFFHDPRGASVGPSVVPSPLAQGLADPLVEAYFQIDGGGRVTVPTLGDEGSTGGLTPEEARRQAQQRAMREALQAASASLRAGSVARVNDAYWPVVPERKPQGKGTKLDKNAYAQNAQASEIYDDLKNARKPTLRVLPAPGNDVEIGVEPLRWRVAAVGGAPRLMALRKATTPDGALMQGFVLSQAAMAEAVGVAGARLTTEAPVTWREVAAAVGSTGLWVTMPGGQGDEVARAQAEVDWQQFLQVFLLATAAVAAAGLLVVSVVARSERLALERSRFAASAAHELRTPLAGLRMYAEMLAEGLGDPGRQGEYARRVALEAERLGRVVGNVLGFTRLERSELSVKPRPGDLASFVEEATLKIMPWAEAMGLTLDLSIESTPAVSFDPDAITQVLQNLVDNAEKYGRTSSDRSVLVATRGLDGGAEIAVSDRGPGVPSALRRRLFSPFSRSTNPDDPPGLGLGLSLAHALVVAHGGRLTHEPNPGGGAIFRVWLPPA